MFPLQMKLCRFLDEHRPKRKYPYGNVRPNTAVAVVAAAFFLGQLLVELTDKSENCKYDTEDVKMCHFFVGIESL